MAENETPSGGASQPASRDGSQPIDVAAEAALNSAKEAIAGLGEPSDISSPPNGESDQRADAFSLPSFSASASGADGRSLEILSDVNLNVKIELGRTRMLVSDVLKLSEGAVVELDKLAGDPVDVYVNDRHVARGEVLVLNDNFCVRVNEIVEHLVEGAPRGGR